MPIKLLFAFIAIISSVSCRTVDPAESALEFYGTDSKRARMSFTTHVDVRLGAEEIGAEPEDLLRIMSETIDEHITTQLSHMFGAFTIHTKPIDFTANPGIPRERPSISDLKATIVGKDILRVEYTYRDIVAFKKDIFVNGKTTAISFYLPEEPGLEGEIIYAKGCTSGAQAAGQCTRGTINKCTDHHYNSKGDFWYFWDPFMNEGREDACPLKVGDLVKVDAKIVPMASTVNTYPDYKRLYANRTAKNPLKITYLVGIDENFRKGDLGQISFRKSFDILTMGKSILQDAKKRAKLLEGEIKLLETTDDVVFNVEKDELRHKKFSYQNPARNIFVELDMYVVDPNRDVADPKRPDYFGFPDKAVTGMRESDVFIYDGHSGLGGYLSVGRLFARRKHTLPTEKYQVFFFNGCSTFSYYNSDYFELKQTEEDIVGSKNLDIVTTSIGALFDNGAGNDSMFIRAFAAGDQPSWQEIIDRIYNVAPEGSALTHVNGDEDNPKKPRKGCSDQLNAQGFPKSCKCPKNYGYDGDSGFCRLDD